MTKILHNPRCTKSRQTLALLEDKGENIDIIEYLVDVPTESYLKEIVSLLGIPPIQLVRKNEAAFKENYKGKNLTDEEWIKAMIQFPKLIERPIVIKNGKAAIGRPPENVLDIL